MNINSPNLKLKKRIKINSGHSFVLNKGHACIYSPYGNASHIETINLTDPENPRSVHVLKFHNAISAITLHNGNLLAAERYRALHVIDLANPDAPVLKDSIPLYDFVLSGIAARGDYAYASIEWGKRIGVFDIKSTFQIQPVESIEFDKSNYEIVPYEETFFTLDGKNTLVEIQIKSGKPEIKKTYFINEFKSDKFFIGKNRIYLFGENKNSNLLVLDLKNPETVIASGNSESEPASILQTDKNSAIILHKSYTCSMFDEKLGVTTPLFRFYEEDNENEFRGYIEVPLQDGKTVFPEGDVKLTCMNEISHAVRDGKYLYTVNVNEFMVWEILKGSVFEDVEEITDING